MRTRSKFLAENRRPGIEISLEGLTESGYDPPDRGKDVEKTLLEQETEGMIIEKVAALARGDAKKNKRVISCWLDGLTDTEAAKELALRSGSAVATQQKYVQRFKKRCQAALA
ncbi:hypothetical protein [Mechercharimyces sp. CAU 1602]|uniref:hypothetical protein n=1 Tax=Mechercharimyces sp. CAU 1602 TaxID=2973933 RepID=UPI0021638B9B|nr:hypothetical protein [Mechercharimyces sp. CAU 1602]